MVDDNSDSGCGPLPKSTAMAIAAVSTLGLVPGQNTKALQEPRNEALRIVVREVVTTRFKGNATEAAKAFKVSQSLVSDFLARKRGAGMKLIEGVAAIIGVDPGVLAFGPLAELGSRKVTVEHVVELDQRYPNFEAAALFALRSGTPTEAVERVRARGHDSETDLQPKQWLSLIEAEALQVGFARRNPETAERDERASIERDSTRADERGAKVPKFGAKKGAKKK
jgi:hypothetical protein